MLFGDDVDGEVKAICDGYWCDGVGGDDDIYVVGYGDDSGDDGDDDNNGDGDGDRDDYWWWMTDRWR